MTVKGAHRDPSVNAPRMTYHNQQDAKVHADQRSFGSMRLTPRGTLSLVITSAIGLSLLLYYTDSPDSTGAKHVTNVLGSSHYDSNRWNGSASNSSSVPFPGASQLHLVRCINSQYVAKPMTWDIAMKDDLASLRVIGSWWSNKKALMPATLVTQLTMSRLPQLYAQCRSWHGPLSAVVYTAIYQDVPEPISQSNTLLLRRTIKEAAAFAKQVEADPHACKLDLLLVYEVYTEKRAMALYPINALRNLARLQARTELLALVDADLLVSRRLQRWMARPAAQQALIQACRGRNVFVLPAFETINDLDNPNNDVEQAARTADLLVTRSKAELRDAIKKKQARIFDARFNKDGHASTNYQLWWKACSAYTLERMHPRYEPWLVVDRHGIPWHDVRYRGYGKNKIVHILHLNATGYAFNVLPQAFIIHRAHGNTPMREGLQADMRVNQVYVTGPDGNKEETIYGHVNILFNASREAMQQGNYMPVLDPATQNCMRELPWWQHGVPVAPAAQPAAGLSGLSYSVVSKPTQQGSHKLGGKMFCGPKAEEQDSSLDPPDIALDPIPLVSSKTSEGSSSSSTAHAHQQALVSAGIPTSAYPERLGVSILKLGAETTGGTVPTGSVADSVVWGLGVGGDKLRPDETGREPEVVSAAEAHGLAQAYSDLATWWHRGEDFLAVERKAGGS